MRQQFETKTGGRAARVSVVGNQIAPANLYRIDPDFCRGEIDQTLGDRTCNRVTDRAVLAHDILVLEHDARAGAVVFRRIRPTNEIDDLIGFDCARARIHRIGTDAGETVDLEGGDGAVAFDG